MNRENLITYQMMKRVHESPNGLMTEDFKPVHSTKVHNYFADLISRGVATLHKEGWRNRYTVDAEQWARYIVPVTYNIRPRALAQVGDPTIYGRLLTMAARPHGVNCDEPGYERNELSVRLSKLGVKGRLIVVKNPRARNQYFVHQTDADAFQAAFRAPPQYVPKPKPKVAKSKIQKGSAFPATVKFKGDGPAHTKTKEGARAKWNATAPTYPVDADGKPLWTFTRCPGFTTDPKFSNTHFQVA